MQVFLDGCDGARSPDPSPSAVNRADANQGSGRHQGAPPPQRRPAATKAPRRHKGAPPPQRRPAATKAPRRHKGAQPPQRRPAATKAPRRRSRRPAGAEGAREPRIDSQARKAPDLNAIKGTGSRGGHVAPGGVGHTASRRCRRYAPPPAVPALGIAGRAFPAPSIARYTCRSAPGSCFGSRAYRWKGSPFPKRCDGL
jgi:hypothetical protein